ncbi:MAG: LysR family transcriptional regulator [Nocardioides sp.]|uniref:LysR family transcriptional regulator n=1 Tax=Nocardioides sp. TaxID=35761 RepID=UPI00326619B2
MLIGAVPRLRVLVAVEETGSFSAAATSLGISQPAVSQHISALERQVGSTLVLRGSRPVELSRAGVLLAAHGRALVARLEAAEHDLAEVLDRADRRLRLGSVPTALASFVPPAIARLRRELPDLALTVTDDHMQGLLPRLRDRELDLAVGFGLDERDHADLVVVPLFEDAYRVLLPTGHRLARATRDPTLADLKGETWVGGAARSTWFNVVRDACRARGFEPRVGVVSDDHVAIQAFVAAGLGVAVVPGLAAIRRFRGVTARDVRGPGPVRQLVVAHPRDDFLPHAATRMTEILVLSARPAGARR